ncbi:autotransporter domain-containing protein [Sphingomonas canadensis]|uniref:Autotransporter domain-containing protein n=1 Tax=Sphingomonas canadensis TaxID=1219257 RepID=A0ABW3H8G7_9SPHN|nr:autotransporter domain-containing protein [Sphingomonas canadensis]MCW3837051.1 autotransporter domain-containing protein [Sphingomonas canadensis]
MTNSKLSRFRRASLFISAAAFCVAAAGTAHAQSDEGNGLLDITESVLEPQDASISLVPGRPDIVEVERDPQIVIGAPGTPTTARDPVNVNGVGQMIVDQGGGFIGLCTATLINPRTVIFAAHCVNDLPGSSYGAANGGTAIGFGFENNLRANAPGETDELVRWLLGGAGGAGRFQTNVAQAFYNSNFVTYHPGSLEPEANQFLYSDIAIASLDTPAKNVPTWAMLFSALPQVPITANGSGYHVTITGYGNNGTGSSGSTGGIDFRRRIAENIVGALASIDDFEGFLFGGGGGLPQNLYWIDFDDPRRGTQSADPRDFNAWRDNPLPREGITASGDSGGPLILDQQYAKQLVIGVLSGGYTRFFNGAPANGYGTASFYQPLYLYWDWIAENNPYRYVAAKAGNGDWTDPNHWVTTVDPNYFILDSNGNLVNGVPTTPGEGVNGTDGKFGQACFEGPINGGFSDCLDMETGTYTQTQRPIGTSAVSDRAVVSIRSILGDDADALLEAQDFDLAAVSPEAQAQQQAAVLPSATIANGLPGATNFVPNNINTGQGATPRYFDVTLSAAGTTTLSSSVTIDRLTISGTNTALNVASGGSLTSLMDINLLAGAVQVNGTLSTPGDFFMMSGGLNGSGTINTPYFTNVAGGIAPGTTGTIGTLTFNGNVILSSGSKLYIDLSNTGASDKIVVKAGADGTTGVASIGGQVNFTFNGAVRANNTYTILTAAGGVQGTFVTPQSLSAILKPQMIYTANSVQVNVQAGNYRDVIGPQTPIAYAYALLLDQNRSNANNYDSLYGPLDLLDAASIRNALNGLAPASETTAGTIGTVGLEAMSGFFRDRAMSLDGSNMSGGIARISAPANLSSVDLTGMRTGAPMQAGASSFVQEGTLPENMSAFVAGGYLNGDALSMPGTGWGGRDNYNGWYMAGGIETALGENAALGFALSYTDLDGTAAVPGQTATGKLYQGTLYSNYKLTNALRVDSMFSAGLFDIGTRRTVSFLGNSYTLRASDQALALTGEVGISGAVDAGPMTLTPRLALRTAQVGFSPTIETGGPTALLYKRDKLRSAQVRGGVTLAGNGTKFRPYLSGTLVHEFDGRGAVFSSNFVGSATPGVLFQTTEAAGAWGEVGGGLTVNTGNIDISLSAETTVARDDISAQTYRGSISFKF